VIQTAVIRVAGGNLVMVANDDVESVNEVEIIGADIQSFEEVFFALDL